MTAAVDNQTPYLARFIPLGEIEFPLNDCLVPSEVKKAEDLPIRMPLGDRDTSSFIADSTGWRAVYSDPRNDSRSEVKFEHEGSRLSASHYWHGEQVALSSSNENKFRDCGPFPFPDSLDAQAKVTFENQYNVCLLREGNHCKTLFTFPDGIHKTVICPIRLSELSQCLKWFQHVRRWVDVRTPLSAFIHLGISGINYLDGKCPPPLDDPKAVDEKTVSETGLPLLKEACWEEANDGSRALTVRRKHYALHVSCVFRELKTVLDTLSEFGLVGIRKKGSDDDDASIPVEFRTLIVPAMIESSGGSVFVWDPKKTRRATYAMLTDREYRWCLKGLECADDGVCQDLIDEVNGVYQEPPAGQRRSRTLFNVLAFRDRLTGEGIVIKNIRSPDQRNGRGLPNSKPENIEWWRLDGMIAGETILTVAYSLGDRTPEGVPVTLFRLAQNTDQDIRFAEQELREKHRVTSITVVPVT